MMCYESTKMYGLFHIYLYQYLNVSTPLLSRPRLSNLVRTGNSDVSSQTAVKTKARGITGIFS